MKVMMHKMIETIGEKVLKEFNDVQHNGYTFENVGEYGDCEAFVEVVCDINHYPLIGKAKVRERELIYVEVAFHDTGLFDNVEAALNEYLEQKFDAADWFCRCEEDYEENYCDEYERNGFRDEADYYRYRYA